jgi:hypothetical protein
VARVRELSADDISAIQSIAGHYLSTFEIEENSELFTAACNEADGTLGRGVERESGLVGFLVATVCARDEPLEVDDTDPETVRERLHAGVQQSCRIRGIDNPGIEKQVITADASKENYTTAVVLAVYGKSEPLPLVR